MSSPEPYLTRTEIVVVTLWNPDYPENNKCICNHAYRRHFDTYEYMEPVGCKYCPCWTFVPHDETF